jgi:hypothetical protein
MGQINFIWGLIGKQTLSLGVQFGLNWENWNFKTPNLISTKLVDWNHGKNRKKIEVLRSIIGQIKEIHVKDQYVKNTKLLVLNWQKPRVKLKNMKV